MKTKDIVDVALPTGVKNLKKFMIKGGTSTFTKVQKGTPAHVKCAIIYNDLLRYFKTDNQYGPISKGEKIKWVYLKDNSLKCAAILTKLILESFLFLNNVSILFFLSEFEDINSDIFTITPNFNFLGIVK